MRRWLNRGRLQVPTENGVSVEFYQRRFFGPVVTGVWVQAEAPARTLRLHDPSDIRTAMRRFWPEGFEGQGDAGAENAG